MKVSSWSGSIEVGVTAVHPETELPACATKMSNGTWVKEKIFLSSEPYRFNLRSIFS